MINSTFLNVQFYYQSLLVTNECTSDCLQGAHYLCTDNELSENGVTAPKHVRAIFFFGKF